MKIRIAALIAGGALLILALAAAAIAATLDEHKFSMSFSSKAPAASTGVKFSTDRHAYKAPAAGESANPVEKIVFTLAPGTRTDPSTTAQCKRSELKAKGSAGCPKGSKVGRRRAARKETARKERS